MIKNLLQTLRDLPGLVRGHNDINKYQRSLKKELKLIRSSLGALDLLLAEESRLISNIVYLKAVKGSAVDLAVLSTKLGIVQRLLAERHKSKFN